jgi:hypothetical protein
MITHTGNRYIYIYIYIYNYQNQNLKKRVISFKLRSIYFWRKPFQNSEYEIGWAIDRRIWRRENFCSCWERNTWSLSKTICFPLLKQSPLSCILFHSVIINRVIYNPHFPLALSYEFSSVSLSNEYSSTTISSASLLFHLVVSVLLTCFACSIVDYWKHWVN